MESVISMTEHEKKKWIDKTVNSIAKKIKGNTFNQQLRITTSGDNRKGLFGTH